MVATVGERRSRHEGAHPLRPGSGLTGEPLERPIQVLSHSPLTCRGVNSYADSAYYTHRGGGGVFNAGTMRWVASFGGVHHFGLNRRTATFTKQVPVNLLNGFGIQAAYDRVFAKDVDDPGTFGVGAHYTFRVPGL